MFNEREQFFFFCKKEEFANLNLFLINSLKNNKLNTLTPKVIIIIFNLSLLNSIVHVKFPTDIEIAFVIVYFSYIEYTKM